jgi:adenylyltransferase/sulfurtransferase
MGVLQALETIKVLTKPASQNNDDPPALHIFSAYSNPLFRTIRLRGRRVNCAVCSSEPTITLATLQSGSTDYAQFCGSASFPQVLSKSERIAVRDFESIYDSKKYTLVDVRDPVQFGICNLENSINIPITQILQGKALDNTDPKETLQSLLPPEVASTDSTDPIYFVCRMGNDSQLAVRKLKELGLDQNGKRFIGDIRGGLKAWKAEVDPKWPEY